MSDMRRHTIGFFGVLLGLTVAAQTGAPPAGASMRHRPEQNPDWPCVQRLVPEIAPGMIWRGPPIEAVDRSDRERVIEELAGELAARRVPIEEARERVGAFAAELDPADTDEELTRLFAETLEIINRDRASIITGIKRFARQQRDLSDEIERIDAALRELKKEERSDEERATSAQRGAIAAKRSPISHALHRHAPILGACGAGVWIALLARGVPAGRAADQA